MVMSLALSGRLALRLLGCTRGDDTSGFVTAAGFFVGESLLLVAMLPATFGHARTLYLSTTALLGVASLVEGRHLVRTGGLRPVARSLAGAAVLALVFVPATLGLTLWPLPGGTMVRPDAVPLATWNHFGSF